MVNKTSEQELSGTPIVGVRLGSLRPRVEAACKRRDVDMSEFIRTAVQKELHTDAFEGYAACLQAARSFGTLMETARKVGLIDASTWEEINQALWNIKFRENGLADHLEKFFEEENPEAVKQERQYKEKHDAWKRHGRKGPEPVLEDSTRDDWFADIADRYDFADMNRVTRLLRQLPRSAAGESQAERGRE